MVYAFLFMIIALANDTFYLVPGWRVHGVFYISDVGILLILIGLSYYTLRNRDLSSLKNFFTVFVGLYLALVTTQASIAAFNYSQSVFDGLVAGRHQLYYLAFPLFVLALDDSEKIRKFMTLLSVAALAIIALGLVNYFHPGLFQHHRAEGHGIRSGMVRAYIPGMEMVVGATLWQFFQHLRTERAISYHLLWFFALYGGIVFRQTRGHLIAVSAVLVLILLAGRRFKTLFAVFTAALGLSAIISLQSDNNLFVNAFEETYHDITQTEGTWYFRMKQIERSWDIMAENFVTGSGGVVIRGTGAGWAGWGDLKEVAYSTDLGYWVWLKFFGYPGILLLILLIIGFYLRVALTKKYAASTKAYEIVRYAAYWFTCILISMVTLIYLTQKQGIIMTCLSAALLISASREATKVAFTPSQPIPDRWHAVSDSDGGHLTPDNNR